MGFCSSIVTVGLLSASSASVTGRQRDESKMLACHDCKAACPNIPDKLEDDCTHEWEDCNSQYDTICYTANVGCFCNIWVVTVILVLRAAQTQSPSRMTM